MQLLFAALSEAANANNELFGTDSFVGEAPQFDDLTMLCTRLDEFMK